LNKNGRREKRGIAEGRKKIGSLDTDYILSKEGGWRVGWELYNKAGWGFYEVKGARGVGHKELGVEYGAEALHFIIEGFIKGRRVVLANTSRCLADITKLHA